ncbi:hypothetical protein IFR05_015915, partial [Cadophora sp. M221]
MCASAGHGNVPSEPKSVEGIDKEAKSANMPKHQKGSEEETLNGNSSPDNPRLPSGSRMGDPSIWTPLPDDDDEISDLPMIVSRSKRTIPKQVIVCDQQLRLSKSTRIDEDEMRWGLVMKRLAAARQRQPPKTLTEFHLFPKLPVELRLKVYKLASRQPRIVALESHHDMDDPVVRDANPKDRDKLHRSIRACPASRVPILMQVHRESRQECMLLYKKEVVWFLGDYVYVNPWVDVLHLGGHNMCTQAIRMMLLIAGAKKHILPRISIDISGTEGLCCSEANLTRRTRRSIETLYGLHGCWSIVGGNGFAYHRFEGLREINFVVGSSITHLQPSEIRPDTKFRPGVLTGDNYEEISLKKQLDSCIERVLNEQPLGLAGGAWIGDKKPAFKFVSFALSYKEDNGKVFEIMTAQAAAIWRSTFVPIPFQYFGYFDFVNRLQRRYHCTITMPPASPRYDRLLEIAIEGAKVDVEKCCKALEEKLVDVEETRIEVWAREHVMLTEKISTYIDFYVSQQPCHRADDAPRDAFGASESSIGIIPGVFRATYKSGIRICADIGQSATVQRITRATNTSPNPSTPKESVYQLKEASNMPGGLNESAESLNAVMGSLDIGENDKGGGDRMGNNGALDSGLDGGLDGGDGGVGEGLKIPGGEAAEAIEIGQIDQATESTTSLSSLADLALMSEHMPQAILKFHLFPRLPKEIRLKIWRLVSTHQRIDASEFVKNPGIKQLMPRPTTIIPHLTMQISPRSCEPPLLQVNCESYRECRKLYKRRRLRDDEYLFNPSTDVLYFSGTAYCSLALKIASWNLRGEIPKVAIDINIPRAGCCSRVTKGMMVLEMMRALRWYSNPESKRLFNYQGPNEVMRVLKCRPLTMLPTRINEGLSFRDASTDGITKDQGTLKSEFEEEIAKIMNENPTFAIINAWVGDN